MSATLYALIMLAPGVSGGFTFTPGFTTASECASQYRGPNVTCFAYDPEGPTWSVFFKQADGTIQAFTRIAREADCKRVMETLKTDTPAACRQLSGIYPPCGVASCPAPQPAPPCRCEPPQSETLKGDPAAFREVTVGPSAIEEKDRPYLEPRPIPPKLKTARRYRQRQPQFDPIGALVSLLTPRDW